jgi:SAM-dependent methyltransferase
MSNEFWEQPEVVERFSAREPDHRLVPLVAGYEAPGQARVLDLGCAGGRNTAFLAAAGFDVWATDSSAAMVERTRDRLAKVLGPEEARRRVLVRRMDDLNDFADASCDLVVALGIYHNAESWPEWQRAVDETARVLRPGGLVLVNHFTPETDLTGRGVHAVPGQPDVYEAMPSGRAVLLDASRLDDEMARRGLAQATPSETVRVVAEPGRRVSVNALYRRQQVGHH